MYVRKLKKPNGRIYLSLVQGYREGGKPKSRTVKSLGYLDELKEQFDDPIAHFEEIAYRENEKAKVEHAPVALIIHPGQKIDKRECRRRNIGCAVPLSIYNSLGIEESIRSALRKYSVRFDVNAVLRLLVIERLFNPGSKQSAWHNRDSYFFKSDFSDDDVYRGLDILAASKYRIVAAMNKAIDALGQRSSLNTAFYDVTNYYFEIDDPDELRRKGMSKEHRKSPIVQMGLLQDKNALPINYHLFPGNTNDCVTMLPVLDELKDTYNLKHVVVVADKGLNTSTNIALNVAKGNGFIFSQSIRGAKSTKALRAWVCSEKGYAEYGEDGFKMKSRQDTKTIHLKATDCEDGHAHDVDMETKTVAFWSRKYAERARHEREETIRRARELVSNPSAYSSATHYGAAKYVEGLHVDAETGELLDTAKALSFNEGKLASDEACDGYYCIITSEVSMSDNDIIDTYRGLWRIEESFKITKSCLAARPVYVRTPQHIEAHFLTCYIALTIVRLMQLVTKDSHSAQAMLSDLSKTCGSAVEDNWWLFDYRSDLTDELFNVAGIAHPTRYMQLSQVKRLLSKKGTLKE